MPTTAVPALKSCTELFIGGRCRRPSSDEVIEIISPVTEQVIGTGPAAQEADIDVAVHAARDAFDHGPGPRTSPAERAALTRIGKELEARLDDVKEAFTQQIGATRAVAAPSCPSGSAPGKTRR